MSDAVGGLLLVADIGIGLWANDRGRNGFLWFFIALFFSPIIAGVILALLKNKNSDSASSRYISTLFAKKLEENQPLPVVAAPTLMLRNDEICHYSAPVDYLVTKNVIVNYQGAHTGGSVRIMKGLSLRAGEKTLTPIRQDVANITPAVFSVTNKRVVLACSKASFDKPINCITSVIPRTNGIEIQIGEKTYQILTKEGIYIYQIINRAYQQG